MMQGQALSLHLSGENGRGTSDVQRAVQPDAPSEQLTSDGRDARGRFTDGNTASLIHGLRSARVPKARLPEQVELLEVLGETRQAIEAQLGGAQQLSPVLRDMLSRYLELEVLASWLGDNLLMHGVLTTKGKRRAALSAYLTVVDRQERFARMLGLERRAKPTIDPLDYVKGKVDA